MQPDPSCQGEIASGIRSNPPRFRSSNRPNHLDAHVKVVYICEGSNRINGMDIGGENGNSRSLMRIGDLAKKAGTTLRTIRYYEQLGLIAPARRTKGGFRLYAEEELRRLRLIKHLQLLDIPLAQVKSFFDQRYRGRVASDIAPAIRDILRQQLLEMENR